MITRLTGKVVAKEKSSVVIDVNGICYEVIIPPSAMNRIDELIDAQGIVSLVTYHYYQVEPTRSTPFLIGFINEVEKEFFEQFITVSGIGPRAAARAINRPISEIVNAIDEADVAVLRSLPGIGPQRAKEIIAKLQGKVGKFGLIRDQGCEPATLESADWQNDALQLLLQLQYKKPEANEMIRKALERDPSIRTTEALLNEVYRQRRKN